ncbi:carbohydrate-binding module family 48 protein [Pseudohyphozyma bogoriensis]|nr:carbohydrate-binding module family 48 protein [Pseudohyphozyma bogoriensis]
MSQYYEHRFTWEGEANQVIVTGTFDEWSSSIKLIPAPTSSSSRTQRFSAPLHIPFGTKLAYKYVVDGLWQLGSDEKEAREMDEAGNVNNVFVVPSLWYPRIPVSEELSFTSKDRNFQIERWDGAELSVLAGYRFGRLISSESEMGSVGSMESFGDDGVYRIEEIDEMFEGETVTPGFFVLLQPEASFSTALSTNFSVSVLGSGHDDYVCVSELESLWELDDEGFDGDTIRRAFEEWEWSFNPQEKFAPISFTTLASQFITSLAYVPPSTALERAQSEEYLEHHFLDCLNLRVKGVGGLPVPPHHRPSFSRDVEDDDWEDAVIVG